MAVFDQPQASIEETKTTIISTAIPLVYLPTLTSKNRLVDA